MRCVRSLTLAALLATSVLTAAPVSAATIDAAGAEAVKTMLQKMLDDQVNGAKLQSIPFKLDGPLKVEPKGTYYAVTYPSLSIVSPDPTKTAKINFGQVAVNMMPTDKEGQWKMAVALPPAIHMTDKGKKISLNIGEQKIYILLDEKYRQPLKLDMSLKNLTISGSEIEKNGVQMKLDEISSKIDYAEEAPGVWSGPYSFVAKNFLAKAEGPNIKEPGTISFGDIKVSGSLSKMDMNKAQEYQKKIAELGESGFDPDKMTAESFGALWKILSQNGLSIAESGKVDIQFNDMLVDINKKTAEGKESPTKASIGHLSYGGDFKGMATDNASGSFHFAIKDIKASGTSSEVPAEVLPYIPGTVSLNVGYTKLPAKTLAEQFGTLAQKAISMEGKPANTNAQMEILGTFMAMPLTFAKAGTVFTISNTGISNDKYALDVSGQYTGDATALYSGTGKMKAVFSGLDQIVTDLQALAADPKTAAEVTQEIGQVLQPLAMMQMMGAQTTDANGKPARTYEFGLDAKGVATLNGAALGNLMGPKETAEAAGSGTPPAK